LKIKMLTGDITRVEAGAVVLGLFEEDKKLWGDLARAEKALEGAVSRLIKSGQISGKRGRMTALSSLGKLPAEWVIVAGLGKKKELSQDAIRGLAAEAGRLLSKKAVKKVAVGLLGATEAGIDATAAVQAITEGALLGTYTFRKHKTKKEDDAEIKELIIVAEDGLPVLKKAARRGEIIARAAILARDLVNEPANFMTPGHMADTAARLAEDHDLDLELLEKDKMQELGMGGLLGVSQGSYQPPKFITLRYKGKKSGGVDLALLGKGITFDSGGISLKPSAKMEEMKTDMAGGGAVLAAMSAIAQLKPAINVIAMVPAAENLPSGGALKPGDVITAITGKTIEIISTDAEGRLILADALGYAAKLGVKNIVDVATLTGAVRIALGSVCTGAFGNDQKLVDAVVAAGASGGERIWPMPMYEEYGEQNKSDVADIQNVGGRLAGAITAAKFLGEFAGDVPWVHLDIGGTGTADKDSGQLVKGATGVPVATLVHLALDMAAGSRR
jgi:leucyl aminopeptidase